MGCGSSKAAPARDPEPAPPPPVEQPEPVISPVKPAEETEHENQMEPESQTPQEPEPTPDAEPQRRSSRVASNDSGLEEDHYAPETPAANNPETSLVAPVEEPQSPVDEEEPDGTRTHSVPSPVFVGTKPGGENDTSQMQGDESVIVHDGEEEVTDLGGTIEADDGLDLGNENEEWNNEDTEAGTGTSAQDIPSLPNDNEEDTLGSGSGSLVIEGTAIEHLSNKDSSSTPTEPQPLTPVEQADENLPPLQRNLTYKREKSAFNRPNSAQSRPQSSFQRPASSNSVKLVSNILTEDAANGSEQRPSSQASRKSVQSAVQLIPETEDVTQIRTTTPNENEEKLSSRPSSVKSNKSVKSTQSISALAARPSSKTSIRSARNEPPEITDEQEPVQQVQSSRTASQVSMKPEAVEAEEQDKVKTPEPDEARPCSKTSQTSVLADTNPEPVAEPVEPAQVSSRAASDASKTSRPNSKTSRPTSKTSRPSSKTSQTSKRVGSAASQRSSGSLKVPELDTAETSGTNMTHAERSASSLEDLEMLQHVMEGTLEGRSGGSDEVDCTEDADTGEPDTEESPKSPTPPVALEDSQNLTEQKPENDEKSVLEDDAQSEMGLDDVQTNKLLDTFSTKNLEASMKIDDTGNEADEDGKADTEVAKSPQEDQEEHISM